MNKKIQSLTSEKHELEEKLFEIDQEYHTNRNALKNATLRQKTLEKIMEE